MTRIALVAPPVLPIPPERYAGTERVVQALGDGLQRRGHQVTLFAPGDSRVPYELVPTVERSLWCEGIASDPAGVEAAVRRTLALVREQASRFDVIHSHLDAAGLPLAEALPVPMVTTFHNRLDLGDNPRVLRRHRDAPLIAISHSQRRFFPRLHWVATIPHGVPFPDLPLVTEPSTDVVLIGRADREKGVAEAIELARLTHRRLRLAAKVYTDEEHAFMREHVDPAVGEGVVEFAGEVDTARRDAMIVDAAATVMLGAWPEPFGLVAAESLVLGTPVIARRAGALPEIVVHGIDGFLVDDLDEARLALSRLDTLDRAEIRRRARERFSIDRMVERHEAAYGRVVRDTGWRAAARRVVTAPPRLPAPTRSSAGTPPARPTRTPTPGSIQLGPPKGVER
jgi:glycosyltransferase involved in cell wall biosynthesis